MMLSSNGSSLVFDFGIEVGGIAHLSYSVAGSGKGALGLAFSESKTYIGQWSDSSNGAFRGPDGAVYANFTTPGPATYTLPDAQMRGGFRYLTIFLVSSSASVQLRNVSCEISFQPTWPNLRAYSGYFHSSDATLNRIWYAGAYTLQTNAVPSTAGRRSPFVRTGWANDGSIGTGATVLVDGAKRDRAVWPGDMGVAAPAAFASTGDMASVRNALQTVYDYQNADGSFPEAGPPLLQQGSDTYHMWTMVGSYNYVLYTDDMAWLRGNWAAYRRAMEFVLRKVGKDGLLDVTGTRDWARWNSGGRVCHAQMILYRTLVTGAEMAAWVGDSADLGPRWAASAERLREATLRLCFDDGAGAFRDNATATTVYAQDANALSLYLGLVSPSSAQAQRVSTALTRNWTPLGPEPPELPGNISPFISGFELGAHLAAGQTARALELMRRTWGWYLAHPDGTGSTVIEGFRTDGSWGYRAERGYSNDPSYVSHAHGWSAGPTAALTEGVLGLGVTGRAGAEWRFAPQFGDLKFAEGGFTTTKGKFRARWEVSTAASGATGPNGYDCSVATPVGTKGVLVLPELEKGKMPKVTVDGKAVEAKWHGQGDQVGSSVMLEVSGGEHTIVVTKADG
jgi:hypothetical protein